MQQFVITIKYDIEYFLLLKEKSNEKNIYIHSYTPYHTYIMR